MSSGTPPVRRADLGLMVARSGSGTPPRARRNLRVAVSGSGSGSPPVFGRIHREDLGPVLVLARSASDEADLPVSSSEITAETGLPPGQVVDDESLRGRTVYIIRDATTGEPVGVRKFVSNMDPRPGHYTAVQNEARNYRDIQAANADWAEHILPFRQSIQRRNGIILDFDWIPGTDLQTYLATATRREAQQALEHAARQLRWLALAGYHHGDVKAENIYRAADGRILLFDFDSANRFINPVSTGHERTRFMTMIDPYVSDRVKDLLQKAPFDISLDAFYLLASRLIRREARPAVFRTRRHRRRSSRARTQRRSRH